MPFRKTIAVLALLTTGCSLAYNVTTPEVGKSTEVMPPFPPRTEQAANALTPESQRQLLATTSLADLPLVVYAPIHLAIPNLNITATSAETTARRYLKGSTVTSAQVVSTTMAWARDNIGGYVSPSYTMESGLWGVTLRGSLITSSPRNHFARRPQGNCAYLAIDIEQGTVIAMRLFNE